MQTMKIPRVTMALLSTSVIKQGWMAYSDKRSSETYNVEALFKCILMFICSCEKDKRCYIFLFHSQS